MKTTDKIDYWYLGDTIWLTVALFAIIIGLFAWGRQSSIVENATHHDPNVYTLQIRYDCDQDAIYVNGVKFTRCEQ